MFRKISFIILSSLAIVYGFYGLNNVLLSHPSPSIIKAEGIVLDTLRAYHLSNYENISDISGATQADIILHYTDEKLYPNFLGTLKFSENQWVFKMSSAVASPKDGNNPFLPFVRKNNKADGQFHFFSKNEDVKEYDLREKLVINFPAGERKHRKTIELKTISNKDVLVWKDEGLGVEYMLPSGIDTTMISFSDNHGTTFQMNNQNFIFNNTSKSNGIYKVKTDCSVFRSSYTVFRDEQIFESGLNSSFEIGEIMFSLKQRFPPWQLLLFLIHYLILVLSIALYYYVLFKKENDKPLYVEIREKRIKLLNGILNPIHLSLIWLRFLITLLAFLGLPILIVAFNFNSNSIFYSFVVVSSIHLLPLSMVSFSVLKNTKAYQSIQKISLPNSLTSPLAVGVILIVILIIFTFCSQNERVLTMPSLHLQKVALIISFALFNSSTFLTQISKFKNSFIERFSNNQVYQFVNKLLLRVYIPTTQNLCLVIYSGLLAIVSNDFGSLLFVFLAVLLIEVINRKTTIKKVITTFGFSALLLFVFVLISGTSARKFYRISYTYFSPDNSFYKNFNQADKESISYIYINLKNILLEPFGFWNDLKIPNLAHSVSDTDFAAHWSLMIGGIFFLLIFLAILFFIARHFFFILKVTLREVRINKNEIYAISTTNLFGKIVSFLVAISLIQLCYQIFSNLMLYGSVLTGQSLIFISVGFYDSIFITALFIFLDAIFHNAAIGTKFRVKTRDKRVPSLLSFKRESLRVTTILGVFIVFSIGIKFTSIYMFQGDEVVIEKMNKESEKVKSISIPNYYDFEDQNEYNASLLHKANEIIENNYLDINGDSKKLIQRLQSKYYTQTEISEYFSSIFKLNRLRVKDRLSYSSFFEFDKKLISGVREPFGKVYGYKTLINGKEELRASNVYYSGLVSIPDGLISDLNAELNKNLETHINSNLTNYNVEGIVLIKDNATGRYVADASFPMDIADPLSYKPYFIGSPKKTLLLYSLLKVDTDNSNFQSMNSRGNLSDIYYWMQWSDNQFSTEVFKYLVENERSDFERILKEDFNLPFHSNTTTKFSDLSFDQLIEKNNDNTYMSIAIGGVEPYTSRQLTGWFSFIANEAFRDTSELYSALNAPLDGTARTTKVELTKYDLDPSEFVCKTGTFEKEDINISSTFVISNKNYTVLTVINGKQPSNNDGVAAKYFFNQSVLPLLVKYKVFQ